MTRLAATLSSPASLWGGLSATVRSISRLAALANAELSGLEATERDAARIRLSSRHWLM